MKYFAIQQPSTGKFLRDGGMNPCRLNEVPTVWGLQEKAEEYLTRLNELERASLEVVTVTLTVEGEDNET